MQYMLKPVAVRLPPELVEVSKAKADEAGLTFTAYIRSALEARNAAPSLLDQPMSAEVVPGQGLQPLRVRPSGGVARETPEPLRGGVVTERLKYNIDPRQCAHPWRNRFGVCISCGSQR
jgi:hypothetical protein